MSTKVNTGNKRVTIVYISPHGMCPCRGACCPQCMSVKYEWLLGFQYNSNDPYYMLKVSHVKCHGYFRTSIISRHLGHLSHGQVIAPRSVLWDVIIDNLGLYSLSCKTSYRQISWSLEAARLGVIITVSLWNLTSISAALLPRCQSNVKAIGKV